jgi:hypothetical protein
MPQYPPNRFRAVRADGSPFAQPRQLPPTNKTLPPTGLISEAAADIKRIRRTLEWIAALLVVIIVTGLVAIVTYAHTHSKDQPSARASACTHTRNRNEPWPDLELYTVRTP